MARTSLKPAHSAANPNPLYKVPVLAHERPRPSSQPFVMFVTTGWRARAQTPRIPTPCYSAVDRSVAMSPSSLTKRLFLPAFAVLCLVACLWAGHLEFQNTDQPISRLVRTVVALGSTQFAIADFDGDRRPDLALLRTISDGSPTSQYSVDFNFSTGHKPAISFVGPSGGMQISPRDVNGDKFADLVVTSLLDSRFAVIFLNDGKGNFVTAKTSDYPRAREGVGFHLTTTMGGS